MVHMVQQEPSLSPAEKTFFRLTCAGEGRVSSYWWHQGDAYLSSYNTGKTNMIVVLAQTPLPCEHVYIRPEEIGEIAEL